MKTFILGLLLCTSAVIYAQDTTDYQIPPRFENCQDTEVKQLDYCFNQEVYKIIYSEVQKNLLYIYI